MGGGDYKKIDFRFPNLDNSDSLSISVNSLDSIIFYCLDSPHLLSIRGSSYQWPASSTEIFLSNDANCAAVGEMMYGNAKDYKDYLFIKYLKILQNTLIIKKREERASFLNILSRRTWGSKTINIGPYKYQLNSLYCFFF